MAVRWIPTTRAVFDALFGEHHEVLFPHETLTDIDGRYGEPQIMTVWGFYGSDFGIIKSLATKWDGHRWTQYDYFLPEIKKDPE